MSLVVAVATLAGCSSDDPGGNPDGSAPDAAHDGALADTAQQDGAQSDTGAAQDDGGVDAGPDSSPPPPELFYAESGDALTVNVTADFEDIPGVTPLTFAVAGGTYVLIANLASPWTADGAGMSFRLVVDGEVVAVTHAQSFYNQMIPLSVAGWAPVLAAGEHTLSVQWKSAAGKLHLGGPVRLIAMRASGGYLMTGLADGTYGGANWDPMPSLSLPQAEGGPDNLVVLHLPENRTAAGGAGTQVRIVRDRGTAREQTVAGAVLHCLDYMGNPQTLPLTLFGAVDLSNGPHTLGVDVKGDARLTLGTSAQPTLMVITAPRPIIEHRRSGTENAAAKAGSPWSVIGGFDPITFAGASGKHLLIFQAGQTWGSHPGVGAKLGIIDGSDTYAALCSEYHSAAALQHLPTTIVTVHDIGTFDGEHSFTAGWIASGNDWTNNYAYLGTLFPPSLLGM